MSRARFCLLQLYSTATQQRINLISCPIQTNSFNLSYPNGDVSFTSIDFCCTLNVDFLCTNDEWRHRTLGVGYIVIVPFSVNLCFCLPNPDGFLYTSGSSVRFFINNVRSLPVYDVVYVTWSVRTDFFFTEKRNILIHIAIWISEVKKKIETKTCCFNACTRNEWRQCRHLRGTI